MDMNNIPVFKMAQIRMEWAAQRQRVITQNVTNLNTPDYRPQDIKPLDFKAMARRAASAQAVKVAMTDPAHQPGTIDPAATHRGSPERRTFETSLDGNTAVLEEQMHKLGDSRSKFMMAASLFERNLAILKTALGRGQ